MARGRLITFEGIDGSGKTTALRSVAATLRAEGVDIMATKEETPTWTGEAVRRAIQERAPPLTTAFLFLADRARHLPELQAALDAGRTVLCDRFKESTLAYQQVTLQGVVPDPAAFLATLHAPMALEADHVLFFELPPDMALARVSKRGAATPYEKQRFLAGVAAAYRRLVDAAPQRFTVIDATQSPEAVAAAALAAVRRHL